jgi:hypothetical protein
MTSHEVAAISRMFKPYPQALRGNGMSSFQDRFPSDVSAQSAGTARSSK